MREATTVRDLHRSLWPDVAVGGSDLTRMNGLTARALRALTGTQWATFAVIAQAVGCDDRLGRAKLQGALDKLVKRGRVARCRGSLAGIRGTYFYRRVH